MCFEILVCNLNFRRSFLPHPLPSPLLFNHFTIVSNQIPRCLLVKEQVLIMTVLFHIDIGLTQLLDSNSEPLFGSCFEWTTYKVLLLWEGLFATACCQTRDPSNHGINLTHYFVFLSLFRAIKICL